jgi:WD40 repeat protein
MPPVPLAERVVEVIADRGEGCTPRYRCGSGCVVVGRTVLTAAHVVAGAVSVMVRGPDKVAYQAAADPVFTGDADGPGPDLALVEITSSWEDVPPMGLATVDRDSPAGDPVERCHAVGYPEFMEWVRADGSRFRETADALGHVPVLSGLAGGLLSVQVSSAPEPLPPARVALGDSPWSGMSGAPVVAGGCLLGVVTEHAPRAGSSAITATPLTALNRDSAHPGWGPGVADPDGWWTRLGVPGAGMLIRLPAVMGRGRSAYWATVQEIRKRTGMLTGRQDELAEIASFAAGEEGYRCLVGEAWAGKTALLAEAVTALPEVDIVCYFLSRREADADSSRFLAAVVSQLASLLDEDPTAGDLYQFRALWQRAAERAATEGRPLLLVVDGLDEDLRPPGLPSVAALLPATAGGRAHVLVSSRPHPELPADIPTGHPLRQVRAVPVPPFAAARELQVLARQEIDDLLRRDDDGLAADVLGLLAGAAGPLAVRDLAALTNAAPWSAALVRRIRTLVTTSAARSLQATAVAGEDRYQFAHESLLAYGLADDGLSDPDFRRRIHQWADGWRAAGWPIPAGGERGAPRYLLDSYPATLARDPQRLLQLAGDVGWIEAVIASVGVDHVLADLRRAVGANPASEAAATTLVTVTGQAYNLRPPQPLDQPAYIMRQLWVQAAELGEDSFAEEIRSRLQTGPAPRLLPQWTTRRISRALSAELGRYSFRVLSAAEMSDGRVVTGSDDGRILIWDLTDRGFEPMELGRHDRPVTVLGLVRQGRVITGNLDGQVLVWDLANPGSEPIDLNQFGIPVRAMAVLTDDQVATGTADGRVLIWDPANPGAQPTEIGRYDGAINEVAALADGQVVTSGAEGRVLVWDPADPGAEPTEAGQTEVDRYADRITRVAALADGRLVTGMTRGRVLVWDLADPGAEPTELGRFGSTVLAMAVLTDDRVVVGTGDHEVLVWDPANPGTEPTELGQHRDAVRTVTVLADGRVITSADDQRVLIWDPSLTSSEHTLPDPYEAGVWAVAMLADGRVITGNLYGELLVWDPEDPGSHPVELRSLYEGTVLSVAEMTDQRVVTGDDEGGVLVWDLTDPGAEPVKLGRDERYVTAVAVLADDQVVTGNSRGRVLVWDPADPGAGPVELGRHGDKVNALGVLGERVVTGGDDGRVLVWDPHRARSQIIELRSEATALATGSLGSGTFNLVIAHKASGFSLWSFVE